MEKVLTSLFAVHVLRFRCCDFNGESFDRAVCNIEVCHAYSGGSFGELRVDYVVQELDLLEEATSGGNATVYDYYRTPRLGKVLPTVGTAWDVKSQPDPLKVIICVIIIHSKLNHPAKGLCKVKKIQKIQKKLGWSSPHPPTPSKLFFWIPITDMDRTLTT